MLITQIKIDWREYFAAFCEKHGPPVNYNEGRILFSDGWMYAKYSHSGPEYPPPTDPYQLQSLQLTYWRLRKTIVQGTLQNGEAQLSYLKRLTETRDAPIYVLTREEDEDGKKRTVSGTVDLERLEQELKILDEELTECYKHLNKLTKAQMSSMRS